MDDSPLKKLLKLTNEIRTPVKLNYKIQPKNAKLASRKLNLDQKIDENCLKNISNSPSKKKTRKSHVTNDQPNLSIDCLTNRNSALDIIAFKSLAESQASDDVISGLQIFKFPEISSTIPDIHFSKPENLERRNFDQLIDFLCSSKINNDIFETIYELLIAKFYKKNNFSPKIVKFLSICAKFGADLDLLVKDSDLKCQVLALNLKNQNSSVDHVILPLATCQSDFLTYFPRIASIFLKILTDSDQNLSISEMDRLNWMKILSSLSLDQLLRDDVIFRECLKKSINWLILTTDEQNLQSFIRIFTRFLPKLSKNFIDLIEICRLIDNTNLKGSILLSHLALTVVNFMFHAMFNDAFLTLNKTHPKNFYANFVPLSYFEQVLFQISAIFEAENEKMNDEMNLNSRIFQVLTLICLVFGYEDFLFAQTESEIHQFLARVEKWNHPECSYGKYSAIERKIHAKARFIVTRLTLILGTNCL